MFLSAIQNYLIAIVVPIIVLQYAFALFCLLKLAYFDVSRKQYILWNIFILIVFFIGGAAFLVYYYKRPDKRIAKEPVLPADDGVKSPEQNEAESVKPDNDPTVTDAKQKAAETDDTEDGASDGEKQ